MYGGRLLKTYGASVDAQRCAKVLKPLKQWFSFRKESKTTTLTKSKPCSHHQSYLAIFYGEVFARREVCIINNCRLVGFVINIVLNHQMSLRPVSLIQESFIYGFGFDSQTLSDSIYLHLVMRYALLRYLGTRWHNVITSSQYIQAVSVKSFRW